MRKETVTYPLGAEVSKSDTKAIGRHILKWLILAVLAVAIAGNLINIECWICDRFDWLPRSVAIEKLKHSPNFDDITIIRVTGIEILGDNQRRVFYDWNINTDSTVNHGYENFRRFDDGWRVQQANDN